MNALILILTLSLGLFAAMSLGWWLARQPGRSGMMDVVWSYSTAVAGAAGALMPAPGSVPARQALVAALALVPHDEELALALVELYQARGQWESARAAYWDHRKALAALSGLAPGTRIETAYRQVVAASSAGARRIAN